MPMDFPDMKALEMAAKIHHFREPSEGETEDQFRSALADHVQPIDFIEAQEIRNKVGWDKWSDDQHRDLIFRSILRNR